MFSRLVTRAALKPQSFFGLSYARPSSEVVTTEAAPERKKFIETSYVDFDEKQQITHLNDDNVPQPYPFNGPERDLVNFPKIKRLEVQSPCRHYFIPEEWFRFFYPKTGVSGPYALGIGLAATLVSKELYLVDDVEFKHTVAFFAWVYVICKSPLAKKISEFCDQCYRDSAQPHLEFKKNNEQERISAIEHEKKEQWRQEGKKILFQAKREAIGLQLEAAYRQNLMNLYHQVKRRLDYQVEVGKIDNRVKQQFMVQWVINSVRDAIAAQPEKETLKKCIADLNLLAAKA